MDPLTNTAQSFGDQPFGENSSPTSPPSFSSVPPRKNKKPFAVLAILAFLVLALPVAVYVSRQSTENRQLAQTGGNACQPGFACRIGSSSCSGSEFQQGTCNNGTTSGVCCRPYACVQDYCIASYGGSACAAPMTLVDDSNCSLTGKRCTCNVNPNPGGGGGGGNVTPTPTPSTGGCQSTWCTSLAQCNSVGGTNSSGAGYCSYSGDVRCCPPGSGGGGGGGNGGGGGGGGTVVCGSPCTQSSECSEAAGSASRPICYGGKCVNPACPTDTEPGSICACHTPTGQCGDKCGYWTEGFQPLCADNSGSSCSWVVSAPACGLTPNATYCLPDVPTHGYTKRQCTAEPSYAYLVDPNGNPVTTQNQIREACLPVAPTPTPTPTPAVIGDYIWNDTNHNGIQDNGEVGIPNVTVNLYDAQGNPMGYTITDSTGHYSFTVPAGTYSVGITLPSGYVVTPANQGGNDATDSDISTTGRTDTFTVTAGQTDTTHDGGLYQLTPTPTPSPIAQCINLKIYKVSGNIANAGSWQLLTSAQLAQLRTGDTIYITTIGNVQNAANIDKARIRVNSNTWATTDETMSQKPKSNSLDPNEFYVSYTIPAGTLTFTLASEVHDAASNRWY